MKNKYNLSFGLFGGHGLEETVALARQAEAGGMSACWIFEDYFYGGAFTTATACALNTSALQIGIGVINPFTRHPTLSAMEAAALDALSKGRLILGMGASNARWMEQMAGIPFVKPIQAALEAAIIIKKLIAERHVRFEGEVFKTGDVHLEFDTYRPDMPVYMGIKGPKALYQAGRIADGVVLSSLTSADYARYAKERVAEGAASAGRNPDDIRIAAYVATYVDDDAALAREKVKPYLARFIGIHGYHPILFEAGLTEDVIRPFKEAAAQGRSDDMIPFVTEALVDKLAIAGTPQECRQKMEYFNRSGVDMPIAFELPGEDPGEIIRRTEKYLLV